MLFVIYCFVLTVLVSLIPEGQGNCRNLKFTSLPKPGYRVENHTVRTIEVFDEDLCMAQCYLEPNCVSYNFHMIIQLSGTHNCDLNNATIEHAEDLGINENYIYRGAENACARNPCKNDATCQAGFTHRDYQCLCVLGYGFEGHDCDEDLEECTVGTHDCDKNAECNNTLGSYKCTCKDGFKGNGTNCTDLDECIGGTQDCDENAECYNTLGSYKCTCKDAFQGNGTNCTDVDECVTKKHSCKGNATCSNTIGSYTCKCKEGYQENEKKCTDIDECSNETNSCAENAVCNNTLGSYSCTCKDGFHGNGTNCTGFTAVFTNLGESGRSGPVSIRSYYRGEDHDGLVTVSRGIQQWTVPYTGEYRIDAIGASGGYGKNSIIKNGGRGARMIGNFYLSKDEIIRVLVGQEGRSGDKNDKTAGGGGGTFVVRENDTPLIIAGGGGGAKEMSEQHLGCDASINTTGNAGNNLPLGSGGRDGHGGQENGGNSGGGGGGLYSNGQNAGSSSGKSGKGYLKGGKGGKHRGGFGGGGGFRERNRGAGGGGGYSGGKGGADQDISCGGGGGSFNNGTNQQNECCHNSAGPGWVTITFLQ
ncbi:fibrillin-1-like [Stylophora pistillata]|uniref:fibrillin-1-like n=1 Tax=Stylophora pistillata TaxID=50429 RepID=UPI000C043BA2|nr:fibrillin-1-like [Stylophora pistillata]